MNWPKYLLDLWEAIKRFFNEREPHPLEKVCNKLLDANEKKDVAILRLKVETQEATEALKKLQAAFAEFENLEYRLLLNDMKVEQKKRLRAEAALRAIADKNKPLPDLEAAQKLARDTLDVTP